MFSVRSIGEVKRCEGGVELVIFDPFVPGLKQLSHFSHVLVLWWADQVDDEEMRGRTQCRPPYPRDKLTGVFACRSEYRPNPIALSTCEVLGVDEEGGTVKVKDIDALDGTPILDLKAYFPVLDRVKEARIPDWLAGWPEWLPEGGIGLDTD